MSSAGFKINPKRFFQSTTLAAVLAIGSNFGGMTSTFLTNTNPTLFRSWKVDQLYGIDHFQRYIDSNNRFEFLYPDSWFLDQNVLLTRETIREKPLQLIGTKASKSYAKSPDIAFKDLNSKGKKNLSVLRATVLPGFSLSGTLGGPQEAAPKLLALIAPPSSGKKASLINVYNAKYDSKSSFLIKMSSAPQSEVSDSNDSDRGGVMNSNTNDPDAIVLEYRIEKEGTPLNQHCLAVIEYEGATDSLFTLTAMAPEPEWSVEEKKIRTIALSFHLNK